MNEIIQILNQIDTQIFLFFNGMHTTFGDYFMSIFTGKWIWVPMYASILFVLFKNYDWKVVLGCIVTIALTITFADQVCASLIRPAVERYRPSNLNSPIVDLVHIVNDRRGGQYGFPSCHASNSFGLALYVILVFRKRWLSLFIVSWAIVNCYTRIYLGLHYPGDLLVGGLVGCTGAYLFYWLLCRYTDYQKKEEIKYAYTPIYVALFIVTGILIYSTLKVIG